MPPLLLLTDLCPRHRYRPPGPPSMANSIRSSPASRCHDDHLSPTFSFLTTNEFALAISVNKQWRRIGSRSAAWPEYSLDRLVNSPLHRELHRFPFTGPRVDFVLPLRVPAASYRASLESMLRSAVWAKHTTHLRLRGSIFTFEADPLVPLLVDCLPSLPRLRSLALLDVPSGGVERLFAALGSRLEALSLSCTLNRGDDWIHVRLLTGLRVLSLLFPCTALLLSPLHQLEALRWSAYLSDSDENRECFGAIRRLSVEHRLRTFQFEDLSSPSTFDFGVLSYKRDDGLAPASFTELSIIAATFVPVVLQLPSVISAEFGAHRWHSPNSVGVLSDETVSRSLKHLRIFDQACTGLWSCPALGLHVPVLESLDFDRQRIGSLPFELAQFSRLRELSVGCHREWLSAEELRSLCGLSQFRQLLLRVHPLHSAPSLSLADLKLISRSTSFKRMVCVVAAVDGSEEGREQRWNCRPSFTLKAQEAQALSDFEVHVRSHSASECAVYALRSMNAASATRLQWKAMNRPCSEH